MTVDDDREPGAPRAWWWLGLLAALLCVGAALLVLGSRRSGGDRSARATSSAARDREAGAAVRRTEPSGVAPREITVAADGWVRGQVVDEDGAAVGEGRLVLWCETVGGPVARIQDGVLVLDEEGRFSGPGCRGRVCAELHHPARVPAEPWILQPGTETLLEARLLPRLWGRVVDPDGQPVPGAAVSLSLPPDEDDPTAVLPVVTSRTTTDADGELTVARIERPPCDPCQQARNACPDAPLPVGERVLVMVQAPGWAPGSAEVVLDDAAEPDAAVEIVLRPATAAITGRLVDARGQALPRALVLARSESRPHEQHRAEADAGTFAFEALAEGPYTLRAIQDGVPLLRHEGVAPGQTVDLVLPDALRDVELRVRDRQGRPWPDVRVDGGPFTRAHTDAMGSVRAQRVAPGAYILRLRPPGGAARAVDLEVPAAPDVRQELPQEGADPAPWVQEIEVGEG